MGWLVEHTCEHGGVQHGSWVCQEVAIAAACMRGHTLARACSRTSRAFHSLVLPEGLASSSRPPWEAQHSVPPLLMRTLACREGRRRRQSSTPVHGDPQGRTAVRYIVLSGFNMHASVNGTTGMPAWTALQACPRGRHYKHARVDGTTSVPKQGYSRDLWPA